jgi:hypothetical protein
MDRHDVAIAYTRLMSMSMRLQSANLPHASAEYFVIGLQQLLISMTVMLLNSLRK